jgi:hypothetical protein
MNTRQIITALLVVSLAAPVAGAAAMQTQSTATQAVTSPTEYTATENADTQTQTNYTRLYIEDDYRNLELKPGQSESFTVTVENKEETSVTIDPKLYLPHRGDLPVEKEWVSIDADSTTLASGAETTVTVTVEVPSDAELEQYQGMISFTNETIAYPGMPARPVHAAAFSVDVYEEPTVHIVDGEHLYTQIQAGTSHTHTITIENTGDQAVPVNPAIANDRHRRSTAADGATFDRSWVELDAPSEIPAGETATVSVTLSPPADANVGDYNTELTLGLKDPARNERNDYWQQIGLRFQVWNQPEQPFTTSFSVSENTSTVTMQLSAEQRRQANMAAASFDVELVGPDGTVIDPKRVETSNSGHVTLVESRAEASNGQYGNAHGEKTFTYQVTDPEAGDWSARIMPENTLDFNYEIIRDEG